MLCASFLFIGNYQSKQEWFKTYANYFDRQSYIHPKEIQNIYKDVRENISRLRFDKCRYHNNL